MSPLQFEQSYRAEWEQLEELLASLGGVQRRIKNEAKKANGEQLAQLYRRACEHLALARARSYPVHMVQRLEHITADAHQVIYQRSELGWSRLKAIFARDFPRAVRNHSRYVWLATALFVLPTLIMGVLVYARPELILSVVDAQTATGYDEMYGNTEAIGRMRNANNDWAMFGMYIRHNIGIAFECFASGIFVGIGSIFFLLFNGVFAGALAGYLTERGLGETFYSFVVTHGAFELTAIVLSGAAGMRIGHSLLAPGRRTRTEALVAAARESIVILYGVAAMLLIAAAIEAFWSSARWLPIPMKYGVAAVCWIAVMSYLSLQGRAAAPERIATQAPKAAAERILVQIDTIAVRLRMRGAMEAADLGVRLCQESRRSVYSCYLFAAIPVTALCLATFEIATWLPPVLLFCAKPWLDRSILFALARSAFGQQSSWRDLWRDRGTVWLSQLLSSLTLRRLSPWRSLTQPVYQLEGLSGSALRKRVKQLRTGKTGNAMLMTSAFGFVELSFCVALFSLIFWFALPNQNPTFASLFVDETGLQRFRLILSIAYSLTVLFLEPFYVAAGFGMYLSRRVELEAWDVEQELRRAFA